MFFGLIADLVFTSSLPTTVARFLMLAWALWLAFALLRWLRWGWECYSVGGIWRPVTFTWRLPRRGPAGPQEQQQAGTEEGQSS